MGTARALARARTAPAWGYWVSRAAVIVPVTGEARPEATGSQWQYLTPAASTRDTWSAEPNAGAIGGSEGTGGWSMQDMVKPRDF